MTFLAKKTAKMLCFRSTVAREELTIEGQKIFDLYNDPSVSPEQKKIAKQQLDEMIRNLENKVETTRRVRDQVKEG